MRTQLIIYVIAELIYVYLYVLKNELLYELFSMQNSGIMFV